MWTLSLPTVSAAQAFATCTRGISDLDKRSKFDAVAQDVAKADLLYRQAAARGIWTRADLDATRYVLSGVDMSWLYKARMVDAVAGREIYDAIKAATRKCPLCGHRIVNTVDHYLPKSSYPALAVNPANLVPACSDCNYMKLDTVEGTLHPYFDQIQEQWLRAEVVEKPSPEPPDTRFFVRPPQNWTLRLSERVECHFRIFGLADLYQVEAVTLLAGEQRVFAKRFAEAGTEGLREHLMDRADSWRDVAVNCWQVALFDALGASDWYCSGGFKF